MIRESEVSYFLSPLKYALIAWTTLTVTITVGSALIILPPTTVLHNDLLIAHRFTRRHDWTHPPTTTPSTPALSYETLQRSRHQCLVHHHIPSQLSHNFAIFNANPTPGRLQRRKHIHGRPRRAPSLELFTRTLTSLQPAPPLTHRTFLHCLAVADAARPGSPAPQSQPPPVAAAADARVHAEGVV